MSDNTSDNMTFNEPIETGPVRLVLHGDEQVARSHMLAARKLLARMKINYGVNERVASGDAGGYYHATRIMGDGCRIETFTNDGVDSIRITVPETKMPTSSSADARGQSTSFTPTPVDFEYDPEWPDKPKPKEEPPIASYVPFLWIGVRIVKAHPMITPESWLRLPRKWEQRLHACLWEPTPPDQKPVILSNRNEFEPLIPPILRQLKNEEVYPLHYWNQHIPSNFEDPRKDPWFTGNWDWTQPLPTAIAYTDDRLCMILPNNVYNIPMREPGYDPEKGDEDVEWDIMFVMDPDNDLNLWDTADPSNPTNPMIGTGSGEYQLKVMATGHQCFALEPCEIEIKVVSGKDQYRIWDKFRTTIESFTNYRMGIMPFGWFQPFGPGGTHPCETCYFQANDHGANPHGPHWWQGMASIYVPPLQWEVEPERLPPPSIFFTKEGEVEIPKTGFEPAAFHNRAAMCSSCFVTMKRYRWDGHGGEAGLPLPTYEYTLETNIWDQDGTLIEYTIVEISEQEYLAAPALWSDPASQKGTDDCVAVERWTWEGYISPDELPPNDRFDL